MRAKNGITGIAVVLLAFLLAACGSGDNQGDTTARKAGSATSSDQSATEQTPPAITALPKTGGIPDKPVCDVISKDTVEKAIGTTVYSADNNDILAGAQPTLCYYYTDKDAINRVEIQWMTRKQADWDNQVASLGDNGAGTVRTKVDGLGDYAIKEVFTADDEMAVGYDVLLGNRDMVAFVTDTSGLSDTAMHNLAKEVVAIIDQL